MGSGVAGFLIPAIHNHHHEFDQKFQSNTLDIKTRCNNFPERCRGCTLSSLATPEGDVQLKPGDTLAVREAIVIMNMGIAYLKCVFVDRVVADHR